MHWDGHIYFHCLIGKQRKTKGTVKDFMSRLTDWQEWGWTFQGNFSYFLHVYNIIRAILLIESFEISLCFLKKFKLFNIDIQNKI